MDSVLFYKNNDILLDGESQDIVARVFASLEMFIEHTYNDTPGISKISVEFEGGRYYDLVLRRLEVPSRGLWTPPKSEEPGPGEAVGLAIPEVSFDTNTKASRPKKRSWRP